MTTSHDVAAMLHRHYLPEGRPPGGILAIEIEAPGGRRRADALWAPLVPSAGIGLVGHEIKISRADLRTELMDPTKCEPWARFCRQWWLTLSDPAIVEGIEIPETWGIMAPPSGRRTRSMTILRPAPIRKLADDGPAWRRLLAWHASRVTDKVHSLESQVRYAEQDAERVRTQLRAREDGQWVREDPLAPRVKAILAALKETQYGSGRDLDLPWLHGDEITDADVIAALLDLADTRAASRDARRDLDDLIRKVTQASEGLPRIAKALAALAKVSA